MKICCGRGGPPLHCTEQETQVDIVKDRNEVKRSRKVSAVIRRRRKTGREGSRRLNSYFRVA